jgi:uncharacterized protein with NRDE domain
MCLLIAMSGVVDGAPLIMAANRDERLDRPAVPMTVLRDHGPRILGGRDELAGGTWLAVNEHGVVAGLTNQPSVGGRDPSKRSRGELPLAFASHASAAEAVDAVATTLYAADYNPCWMLVGDRSTLFFIGIAGHGEPEVERLGPGLYVLENAPLRPRSAKAEFVTGLIDSALSLQADRGAASTLAALETVLGSHKPAIPEARTDATGRVWPPEVTAACVHVEGYGTRSAMTVLVPVSGVPSVRVADGRPCESELRDATDLWSAQDKERATCSR